MRQRFYFDTSVIGGVFDNEFDIISTLLFKQVSLGNIICVYSDLSEAELSKAPKKFLTSLINYQKSISHAFSD